MKWTAENIATLTRLWEEGQSARAIALALGDNLSRNAVIGKARRLGLAKRPSPIGSPIGAAGKKKPTEPAPKQIGPRDIRDGLCRWPFGDPKKPEFHFCGKPCDSTKSYCTEHRAAAFTDPPIPTRRGDGNADANGYARHSIAAAVMAQRR